MRGWDLGVGDALVLADLLGDGGAELGRGDDVVEVVDLHDGGDGAARLPEEVEHAVPRLLQRRRVRRHLHRAHRERHLSLSLSPSLLRRIGLSPPAAAAVCCAAALRWLRLVVVVVVDSSSERERRVSESSRGLVANHQPSDCLEIRDLVGRYGPRAVL